MTNVDENKSIAAQRASNPIGAFINARERNLKASELAAFRKAEHVAKVEKVQDIVKGFFKVYKGFYVNHRANNGKSFSVVKVDNPNFPNVSNAVKQATYANPLREMGVEVVFSKRTNSYLYRIYC